jgi:hypothetical protein
LGARQIAAVGRQGICRQSGLGCQRSQVLRPSRIQLPRRLGGRRRPRRLRLCRRS